MKEHQALALHLRTQYLRIVKQRGYYLLATHSKFLLKVSLEKYIYVFLININNKHVSVCSESEDLFWCDGNKFTVSGLMILP